MRMHKKSKMAKAPKVTVIMPAFNEERFVKEAIESVLCQTMKNFEFIIVNDGSTDKTGRIIRRFRDKRIKYFERKKNFGKAKAVNSGLKIAKGKYCCIFDADDIMVNYKLEVSSKILDKHPKCGLLYGNAWIINENSEITGPLFFPSRAKRSIDDCFPNAEFSLAKLAKECFIPQGSTMFRTSAIKKIGGIDENLKSAEDWDLWLRIAEKYSVYYLPVPLYMYRINPHGLLARSKKLHQHLFDKQCVRNKFLGQKKAKALKEKLLL